MDFDIYVPYRNTKKKENRNVGVEHWHSVCIQANIVGREIVGVQNDSDKTGKVISVFFLFQIASMNLPFP